MIISADGIVHELDYPDYKEKKQRCKHCNVIILDYSSIDPDFEKDWEPSYLKGRVTTFGDPSNEKDFQFVEGIVSIIYCNEDKYSI